MQYINKCLLCVNRTAGTDRCEAFPNGIPSDIFIGKTDHNEIIEGQNGDYIFTAIDSAAADFLEIVQA